WRDGICLPFYIDGDCAMDSGSLVFGNLTVQEEAEWIGRNRSKLKVSCGEFMILGGAIAEDFETALEHFEAPDPHFVNFSKFRVAPGNLPRGSVRFRVEHDREPRLGWHGRHGVGEAIEGVARQVVGNDSPRPALPGLAQCLD